MLLKNKIILNSLIILLGVSTIVPAFAVDPDRYMYKYDRQESLSEKDKARLQAYNKVAGLLADRQKKLIETSLALDLMKSSYPKLILDMFKDRSSSAAVTFVLGTGAVGFSYALRAYSNTAMAEAARNSSKALMPRWIVKPVTRASAATGFVLIGTGLYISFSDRAKVYEAVLAEIAKMSDDEKASYTLNKADRFDLLYAQVQLLEKARECVLTNDSFDGCLDKIVIK